MHSNNFRMYIRSKKRFKNCGVSCTVHWSHLYCSGWLLFFKNKNWHIIQIKPDWKKEKAWMEWLLKGSKKYIGKPAFRPSMEQHQESKFTLSKDHTECQKELLVCWRIHNTWLKYPSRYLSLLFESKVEFYSSKFIFI